MAFISQLGSCSDSDDSHNGLGLALSRRLCLMMGGDISATSEAGIGSTFTIRLPVAAGEQSSETETDNTTDQEKFVHSILPAEALDWIGSLVLVIDDDPVVCDLLSRCLTEEGFMVETASSGEIGQQLAQEIRPDVIILDVLMPNTDGWNVLIGLKTDPILSHIPVIMLTIFDERERGLRLGAADYLTKPIDQAHLIQMIKKYQPLPYDPIVTMD